MSKMSTAEVVAALSAIKRPTMMTIVAATEPAIKSPKTTGMAGRIKKLSRVNVMVGFRYENSVNNQRNREAVANGDSEVEYFIADPRKWGVHIEGTPLVEHKGEVYLETKVNRSLETQYTLDDKVVPFEVIKDYLRPHSEGTRQEVENPVILRDYKVTSLRQLTLNGEVIEVG